VALFNRYSKTRQLNFGRSYGISYVIPFIRNAVLNGDIRYSRHVLKGNQRLDTLAGEFYSDGTLGWVIAAASGIGWGLQVPEGTEILVPILEDIQPYL
jgi:hypothetical protein